MVTSSVELSCQSTEKLIHLGHATLHGLIHREVGPGHPRLPQNQSEAAPKGSANQLILGSFSEALSKYLRLEGNDQIMQVSGIVVHDHARHPNEYNSVQYCIGQRCPREMPRKLRHVSHGGLMVVHAYKTHPSWPSVRKSIYTSD